MSKTICVFGDSITHGVLDEENGGWVERLKLWLWENWDEYETNLYNLGIDGDTADGLLVRFDSEAKSRQPDVVILSIGINDSLFYKDGRKGNEPPKFEDEYIRLLRAVKEGAGVVVSVGLTSVDESKTQPVEYSSTGKSYKNERIKLFDEVIKGICIKEEIPYLHMFDLLKPGDLPDGLHPNAPGHQKIFERVKDFLIENELIANKKELS